MTGEPQAVGPVGGNLGAAIAALSDRRNTRVARTLGLYLVGATAYQAGKQWYERQQASTHYTVAVPSDDDIYPELHEWLLERMSPPDRRALIARTIHGNGNDGVAPVDASAPKKARLRLFYDGKRSQTISIDGHRVYVGLDAPDDPVGKDAGDLAAWFRRERLVFTARGEQARDAVLAVLDDLIVNMQDSHEPRLFISDSWGNWERCDLPARTLDTVILRAGQKERILADLHLFLDNEPTYVKLGIPYHRSILLHGPAGTGKTSVAKALASAIGFDLRYAPLSMVRNDEALFRLFNNVGTRSVLLLEDVDIAHGAKKRDDSEQGVTLAGLLNGLDGVATPHGLVVIMTTNDRSVLDPALIRPGRVDRDEYLGAVDDEQLAALVELVDGRPVALPPLDGRTLMPAAVVELFKRHLGRPDRALDELCLLVSDCDSHTVESIPTVEVET